jgi:hypothetical protein
MHSRGKHNEISIVGEPRRVNLAFRPGPDEVSLDGESALTAAGGMGSNQNQKEKEPYADKERTLVLIESHAR